MTRLFSRQRCASLPPRARAPLPRMRSASASPRTLRAPPRAIVASAAASTPRRPLASARRASPSSPRRPRRSRSPPRRARAETVREMYVAAGTPFLEKEFSDLKYAGVKTVTPGLAGGVRGPHAGSGAAGHVRRRSHRSHEVAHARLLAALGPHQRPGQFREIGPEYRAARSGVRPAERAEVERSAARSESSGHLRQGKSPSSASTRPTAMFEDAPKTNVASSSPTRSSWRRRPRR